MGTGSASSTSPPPKRRDRSYSTPTYNTYATHTVIPSNPQHTVHPRCPHNLLPPKLTAHLPRPHQPTWGPPPVTRTPLSPTHRTQPQPAPLTPTYENALLRVPRLLLYPRGSDPTPPSPPKPPRMRMNNPRPRHPPFPALIPLPPLLKLSHSTTPPLTPRIPIPRLVQYYSNNRGSARCSSCP